MRGPRIDETPLALSPWRSPRVIALAAIDRAEIVTWTYITDVRFHLAGGEVFDIADLDKPDARTLAAVPRSLGLRVVDR